MAAVRDVELKEAEVVRVYTDGSCLGNPGPGGWAFILVCHNGTEHHCSSGEVITTNNRMELRAVIEALTYIESLAESQAIHVYTDSLWVMNCAQGKWKRKANLDMWKEYDQVGCEKKVFWHWVRGHNGHIYNERVDKLARKKAIQYNTL